MLAGLITANDFGNEELSKKDRQRLRGMLTAIDKDRELTLEVPAAADSLARVRLAANLD